MSDRMRMDGFERFAFTCLVLVTALSPVAAYSQFGRWSSSGEAAEQGRRAVERTERQRREQEEDRQRAQARREARRRAEEAARPKYEKDDAYWRTLLMERASSRLPEFTPVELETSITIATTSGEISSGVLQGITPVVVILDGNEYRRDSLSRESRMQLFANDWAMAQVYDQVLQERQVYIEQCNRLRAAIASARKAEYYEELIEILSVAIVENPEADEIELARRNLTQSIQDLRVYQENTAKGLERYNGEWMTPEEVAQRQEQERRLELARRQQSREEQARRQAAITSAACRGCYRNFQAAQSAARAQTQHNAGNWDALREANIGGGGAIEGPAHLLHRYKVVGCRNCNGYRIVLE